MKLIIATMTGVRLLIKSDSNLIATFIDTSWCRRHDRLVFQLFKYLSRDYADGLETRALPYYKVHISVSAITVKGKKYRKR